MALKLRAVITIEIEATDFIDAADHQHRIQAFADQMQAEYPQAHAVIRERRGPRLKAVKRSGPLRRAAPSYGEVRRAPA